MYVWSVKCACEAALATLTQANVPEPSRKTERVGVGPEEKVCLSKTEVDTCISAAASSSAACQLKVLS